MSRFLVASEQWFSSELRLSLYGFNFAFRHERTQLRQRLPVPEMRAVAPADVPRVPARDTKPSRNQGARDRGEFGLYFLDCSTNHSPSGARV